MAVLRAGGRFPALIPARWALAAGPVVTVSEGQGGEPIAGRDTRPPLSGDRALTAASTFR
jgi:hypothetical protein